MYCKCGNYVTPQHWREARELENEGYMTAFVIYIKCPTCQFTLHSKTTIRQKPKFLNHIVVQEQKTCMEYMSKDNYYYVGTNDRGLYEFIVF